MSGCSLQGQYRYSVLHCFKGTTLIQHQFNTSYTPVYTLSGTSIYPILYLSTTVPYIPFYRLYWPYTLSLAIPSIILSLGHTWYIYLALAIPGYIYLALAIPGYIQLSMAIPGYIQLSMAVPGYIPTWPYPGIYQHGRTRVYTYPDIPVRLVYDSPLF